MTMTPECAHLLEALSAYRIHALDERFCQEAIEKALIEQGVDFEREARLSPRDRIDFLVGSIGIEVKVKGTRSEIIRQLGRYARSERVQEIVLASTVRRVLYQVPSEVLAVPVHGHLLQGDGA